MKLCVIFPGIGYRNDMPLLYYSKKIAKQYGYEIKEVNYNGFPKNLLGNKENMQKAFLIGYEQLENQLNDIQWNTYSSILFISKSIGTALSSYYAKEHQLDVSSILFTPVPQTFDFISSNSIVFHGTSDPWMKSEIVYDQCNKQNLPLFIVEDANHSLEIQDIQTNIKNLSMIMNEVEKYIKELL